MKVLFAGDTHGNSPFVRYLIDCAVTAGARRVVQVGDFGYWEHERDGVEFLDRVEAYAAKRDVVLVFVDGNHDNLDLLRRRHTTTTPDGFVIVRDHVWHAPRGHRWTWDETSFMSLGGAYSVDRDRRLEQEAKKAAKEAKRNEYRRAAGAPERAVSSFAGTLWFPGEELTDTDVAAATVDQTPVDVLVTHDKPRAATISADRVDFPDSWANQDRVSAVMRVVRPRLLVHGHLHVRYTDWVRVDGDAWTRVEGLGADDGARRENPRWRARDAWMVLDLEAGSSQSLEHLLT